MTNFEHLASDKYALAALLDKDEWYCTTQCPNHIKKKFCGEEIDSCKYDECVDKHTTLEVAVMWLDAEYE